VNELTRNSTKRKTYQIRAAACVAQMTLEEKVHQMLHTAPAIPRLGIKAYNWWNEGLHGVARAGTATVFPQAIGLAAIFDEDIMEEIGDAISTEARAKYNVQQQYSDTDIYKGLTFWSPNVNIFRDPRWGRGHETYGEDPYLTARLGVRFINGLQGHDENYLKTAACAKHFAVHSGPEDLRHHFNAVASAQDLAETYLPAFKACVTEGHVEAVMGAYNRANGEPCCGSETLLVKILRGEWGFTGHVVSDCWAIRDFHLGHKVTTDPAESCALAVRNGCDVNCGNLFVYLLEAVERGLITEAEIDQAVTRLFTTRMMLGMFDGETDVPFNSIGYDAVDSKEMQVFNLSVARKSLVLLKNENNFLPLDSTGIKTIGVIGPNANSREALVGNYEGTASRYVTVLEGIQDYIHDTGADVQVRYSVGCHLYKSKTGGLSAENDRLSEVKAVCAESDVIVACLGLDGTLEGEEGDTGNEYGSGDKPNLHLPGLQQEILEAAYASGKPVVLVLLTGSALAVNWADTHLPAIVQAFYPGAQGGRAIAELLFGAFSPEGKLPVTFYKSTEELPDFTDYTMKGRTYRYMTTEPLYPFGFGLSYADFVLSTDVSYSTLGADGLSFSVTLTNRGTIAAAETLQIYIKHEADDTPNAQLKHLRKLRLAPSESQTIAVTLPRDVFALADENGVFTISPGAYTVYVGTSQPDARSTVLTGKQPIAVPVTVL